MMTSTSKATFHIADYVIFVLTVMVPMGIGIYSACSGGHQRAQDEYLFGNRKMHVVPVIISLATTFLSSIIILGVPAEIYFFGMQFLFFTIGAMFTTLFLVLAYVPLLYPLKLVSAFEYLEMRYKSPPAMLLGTFTSVLSQLCFAGVATCAPAIAMQSLSNIPAWVTVCSITAICTVYTAIGGIRAVVWSGVFQGAVMLLALIVVTIMGTLEVGSVTDITSILESSGRLEVNFDPNPTVRTTFWTMLVGMTFQFTCLISGQTAVQRFGTLPTMKQATLFYILAIPVFYVLVFLSAATGAVAFAYYKKGGCDPMQAGYIQNQNEILPYFIADVLRYPGVIGVFTACVFSSVVSTVSSMQNSLAAVIWQDCLKWKYSHLGEWIKTLILKIIVGVIGILTLIVALFASKLDGSLLEIYSVTAGAVIGSRFAMFALGGATSYVGGTACFIGSLTGIATTLTCSGLSFIDPPHWSDLPADTTQCDNSTLFANGTMVDNYTLVTTARTTEGSELLGNMYHISCFYYPLLGFLVTTFVTLLLTILPDLRYKAGVENKLRFPCGRVETLHDQSINEYVQCEVDDQANVNVPIEEPKRIKKASSKKRSREGDTPM